MLKNLSVFNRFFFRFAFNSAKCILDILQKHEMNYTFANRDIQDISSKDVY